MVVSNHSHSNGVSAMATQLTMEERETISRMQATGESAAQMAYALGRHRSTIYRELSRNRAPQGYRAVTAHQMATQRRKQRLLVGKMDRPEIRELVIGNLVQYWSPEQIAGRSRLKFGTCLVSHQTIYTWVQNDQNSKHWRQFLRHSGRKRRGEERRGRIPKQVTIKDRPKIVDQRKRCGDWEGDTMRGGGGCSEVIVTLVERKTGFMIAGKAKNRTAAAVGKRMIDLFARVPVDKRKTLTLDNGKEFATHAKVKAKLALPIYFARPYCSYERGTNENANGLLRQFVPKKSDLGQVSHQSLADYVDMMNDRPRKRLNYKTPSECFESAGNVATDF
jgi:IS30 family transposase